MQCKFARIAPLCFLIVGLISSCYRSFVLPKPDKKLNKNKIQRKFVVLSSTVGSKARSEDYTYLAPLVARNWNRYGFTPIIVLVASTTEDIDKVTSLWSIILSSETIIIPLVVMKQNHQVSIAQVGRLFAVSALQESLHESDFVRITDGDMMIADPLPFEPPADNSTDISAFNGQLGEELPMHSVGMKAALYRRIFPVGKGEQATVIISQFYNWTRANFPSFYNQTAMKHGGDNWGMDQKLLTEKITDAVKRYGYRLKRMPGPRHRLHVSKRFANISFVDVHLARFSLASNGPWLDSLIEESVLLFECRQKYKEYTRAWKEVWAI